MGSALLSLLTVPVWGPPWAVLALATRVLPPVVIEDLFGPLTHLEDLVA